MIKHIEGKPAFEDQFSYDRLSGLKTEMILEKHVADVGEIKGDLLELKDIDDLAGKKSFLKRVYQRNAAPKKYTFEQMMGYDEGGGVDVELNKLLSAVDYLDEDDTNELIEDYQNVAEQEIKDAEQPAQKKAEPEAVEAEPEPAQELSLIHI